MVSAAEGQAQLFDYGSGPSVFPVLGSLMIPTEAATAFAGSIMVGELSETSNVSRIDLTTSFSMLGECHAWFVSDLQYLKMQLCLHE